MKIKKNIWAAFYLIVLGGIFLLMTLSYMKWKDIKEEYHLKYETLTEIVGHTSHSMFDQNELMLEVLGIQLFEDGTYKDVQRSQKLFYKLFDKNPMLAGFGLIGVDGNLLVASSNIDISKVTNFLENNKTRSVFEVALQNEEMVLGRTHYVKALDQWLLPLRKSIRDKNGTVLGVVTTGLKINKNQGFLNQINKINNLHGILIVKDFDHNKKMYRQFFGNIDTNDKDEIYSEPLSNELIQSVTNNIKKNYNLSLDDLRRSGESVILDQKDTLGKKMTAGLLYDKKYKLWVFVEGKYSVISEKFRKIFFIYCIIFILSLIVLYALFKYIAKAERTKENELLFQVTHDDLTGLPNRSYLYKYSDSWIASANDKFDILFIDLDNFKNINDNFGHIIGDKVLIEVANRVRSYFKKSDLVLRQGGDEFIVLMNRADERDKYKILEGLIKLISQLYFVDNMEFSVGVSIGSAQYPEDASSLEELMSIADLTMYEAKKRKNAFCIFSSDMKSVNSDKVVIEQELRNALNADEFGMVYQPQINADGSFHGVEALVRWKNEKLGPVFPDKFISIAEEMGFMPQLGNFIVKRSLEEIKVIQANISRSFQLSINISVRQLIEIGFLQDFINELERCDFDKSLVTLEITESLFIEDIEYILPLLKKIKENGIKLSLDDFGTGYSSLSMLRKLPINELKIDKSFVDEILNVEEDKAMVESIINIGKNLSMMTLAEGVETEEQVNMLRNFGCDIFQGYYFAKPLSKDELFMFLKKNEETY